MVTHLICANTALETGASAKGGEHEKKVKRCCLNNIGRKSRLPPSGDHKRQKKVNVGMCQKHRPQFPAPPERWVGTSCFFSRSRSLPYWPHPTPFRCTGSPPHLSAPLVLARKMSKESPPFQCKKTKAACTLSIRTHQKNNPDSYPLDEFTRRNNLPSLHTLLPFVLLSKNMGGEIESSPLQKNTL